MTTYRTPGVYVEEISLFPPSVVEVGTAIPAFVGYTQKAEKPGGKNLHLVPTQITSLLQYEEYFGKPFPYEIDIAVVNDPKTGLMVDPQHPFAPPTVTNILYYAVKMFFDNGGGTCYIVSVGPYGTISADDLNKGVDAVGLEDEPTLIVAPEAVRLSDHTQFTSVVTKVLSQCNNLQDRFGIFDVYDGTTSLDDSELSANRSDFVSDNLSYGAAYYPFVTTDFNYYLSEVAGQEETNVKVTFGSVTDALPTFLQGAQDHPTAVYAFVKAELQRHYIDLPPSGAVAGLYARIDSTRGVWKAPANAVLKDVTKPVVRLDDHAQESFNVDASTGKSINAIRSFTGVGTKVWGARTLDGNSNEWRYVSTRRFFITVEESVKKATFWAVFEPNDANTWVKVRGMIESYLTDKWREGALAGATPKEAFFVKCGLGSTMSAQDILEGRMNVEIGMAVVRPAEFIILKFTHKMQTS